MNEELMNMAQRLFSVALQLQEKALSTERPATTARPTPIAHTENSRWPAADFTSPKTQPSSQSVPVGTESGPAERSSECAHPTYQLQIAAKDSRGVLMVKCHQCHAYLWFDMTPAPAVAETTSTSARVPLSDLDSALTRESAASLSRYMSRTKHDDHAGV